ncbi:PREDICTED: promethin isoform X1 [Myotis brandtii]|uniref:promethin isoform X1 n=1 Tax=Myotis brandtii TaxID=109478 RepID=UPI000703C4DF|nr:PREDICTED: promethin isoform X1 [Myotis brandtii]
MAKEDSPSASKDLQELQRKLSLLIESVQNNSKVVAFMKSPVGQYLDRHPFAALTLLVFVVMSAVPIGFFLLLVVLTSLAAFVGVMLLEGTCSVICPLGKMTQLGEHCLLGICNSGQRSLLLSKSHGPRPLVRVVKTRAPESALEFALPVQCWTSSIPSLSLRFLFVRQGHNMLSQGCCEDWD